MNRSRLLIVVAILQTAVAVFFCGIIAILVAKIHNPAQFGSDAADVVSGLKIAAWLVTPFAAIAIIAAVGMWFRKRWARWLAAAVTGLFAAALLSDVSDWLQYPDWDDVSMTSAFVALTIIFLLPAVGRAMRGSVKAPSAAASQTRQTGQELEARS